MLSYVINIPGIWRVGADGFWDFGGAKYFPIELETDSVIGGAENHVAVDVCHEREKKLNLYITQVKQIITQSSFDSAWSLVLLYKEKGIDSVDLLEEKVFSL